MRILYLIATFILIGVIGNYIIAFNESSKIPSFIETDPHTAYLLIQKDGSGQYIAPSPVSLIPFNARWTEPFWAFEQTATWAKYSAPWIAWVDEFLYSSVQTNSGGQIIVVATPIASGSVINLTLTPGTCSDGMSDIVYSYSASWTLGSGSLVGCAN
jgi:uncharacterized membrane protein